MLPRFYTSVPSYPSFSSTMTKVSKPGSVIFLWTFLWNFIGQFIGSVSFIWNEVSYDITDFIGKGNNAFQWVSAHISGFNIGAPIEYAIHEINALREVFWQRVGKFLLKSIIALLIWYQSDFCGIDGDDFLKVSVQMFKNLEILHSYLKNSQMHQWNRNSTPIFHLTVGLLCSKDFFPSPCG